MARAGIDLQPVAALHPSSATCSHGRIRHTIALPASRSDSRVLCWSATQRNGGGGCRAGILQRQVSRAGCLHASRRQCSAPRLLTAPDASDADGAGLPANSAPWAMDRQFASCLFCCSQPFSCMRKLFRFRPRLALRFPRGPSPSPSLWLSSSLSLMAEGPVTNSVETCLPCNRWPHRGQNRQ